MYPILFRIGSVIVPSYGFMLSLAFVIGTLLMYRLAEREGISPAKILQLIAYGNISAIIGARLFFGLVNYGRFSSNPLAIFSLSPGGFAFYGGFVLAFSVSFLFIRKSKLSPGRILDLSAPSISVGIAIAKIGCFLAGCCHGKECTVPWGVRFPPGSHAADLFGLDHKVHPVQLYSSFGALAIFLFLLLLRSKRTFQGQLFLSFVILYSTMRAITEMFRGHVGRGFIYSISASQLVSLILLVTAVVTYVKMRTRSEALDTI